MRQINDIDTNLQETQIATFRDNRELDRLKFEADNLQDELDDFKTKSVDIESSNVEGLYHGFSFSFFLHSCWIGFALFLLSF